MSAEPDIGEAKARLAAPATGSAKALQPVFSTASPPAEGFRTKPVQRAKF
jgi:hypothetical protein